MRHLHLISKRSVGIALQYSALSVGYLKININSVPKINLSRRRSIGAPESGKYFMWEKLKISSIRCVNPFYRLIIVAQGNKNLVKTNDYLSNFEQQQKDKQITESKVGWGQVCWNFFLTSPSCEVSTLFLWSLEQEQKVGWPGLVLRGQLWTEPIETES